LQSRAREREIDGMQPSAFVPEIYAIDFGTTNSLLAAANRSSTQAALSIDPGVPDPTVFRSILYFDGEGACWFGAEALKRYAEQGMQAIPESRSNAQTPTTRNAANTFAIRQPRATTVPVAVRRIGGVRRPFLAAPAAPE
jgi:hypothetical protein